LKKRYSVVSDRPGSRGQSWPKEITRRWARRGSRPSAPSDQRTASTYIFGAICPKHALIDHCCDAWNKLEAQPWTIMSLGMRDWAYRF